MKVRLLAGNFASMASLRLGLAGLTFALFWLLSHHLTTGQLGGFSLLMNVFFMVQALPLLGMTMRLMRRVAAHPTLSVDESSNSFFFALPIAVLLGFALLAAGFRYRGEGLTLPFALLGLSIVPTAWTLVAESVLVGAERMHGIAYVNLLEALGRLLGAWAAIQGGFGLTGVFSVFAVMRFAAALAYLINPHLTAPQWRRVRRATLRTYLREAPTYLAISVVTGLCTRLDVILVSKLLSLREAGIYAAAARLSDAALMIPTMAAVVIFPTQARLFEADRVAFARFLEQAVRWCLIGGFAAAFLVVALSPLLIRWLYTPNLAPAVPLLQILILGTTVMVVDQLLSTTMMAAHAQRNDLRSMCLGLVVLATLLVVLTHYFGLRGAAMASPTALIVRVLYRLTWAQRELAMPLVWLALRVVLAAAAASGVLFVQAAGIGVLDMTCALATYGVVLWLTGSVRAADWASLRQLIAHRRAAPT